MKHMFHPENAEVKFALNAVRRASQLVSQIQAELASTAITKDDRSPVTIADFASQALVGHFLEHSFPDDALVAEEDSSILRSPSGDPLIAQALEFVGRFTTHADAESIMRWIDHRRVDSARRFWTLDPIDGTKGFLRGEQYAVALALVVDGQVQLGVLGCPNLAESYRPDPEGPGSLVVAVRGQGTWSASLSQGDDFVRLQVSDRSDPSQARILRSVEAGHTNVDQIDTFALHLGVQVSPVRMDSQAKYAVLAAGKGDLILRLLSPAKLDYKERIWDQAAGSLVLEEAGGRITDLDGKTLDFTRGRTLSCNRGVLASNGRLHSPALSALKAIGA